MPRSTSKYSLAQIREINNLFSNDDVYTQIYNAFYNNASKEKRKNVATLRNKIILRTSDPTAFKGVDAQTAQDELDNLLSLYKNGATTTKLIGKSEKKVQSNLVKSSQNLLKIIHGLTTNVFKFNDPEKYAKKLVNDSDKKTQMKFSELQAYTAITKKLLAQEKGTDYEYSNTEEAHIIEVLGKDSLKKEYSLGEIYPKLEQSYYDTANIDFVKATAKTNYLKRSGVHRKQILTALFATGVASAVLGSSVMGSAPVDASFLSTMKYVGTQILPWAGAGFVTVGGYNTARRLSSRARAEKVRQQVRTQIGNKELFFKILDRTRPAALSKADNLVAAIENTQGKKIDLNNTHFTQKSLSRLLGITKFKMLLKFTQKGKDKTIQDFKRQLYSHGIKGELPSNEELSGIITESYSRRARNRRIDDAIKNLHSELKKNEKELLAPGVTSLNLDLGDWKSHIRENYLHMIQAQDKIERSSKLLGAPLFTSRKKARLDKKRTVLEANYTKETVNISELSPKNPVCEILNVTGTKKKGAQSQQQSRSTRPTPQPILAFARQEATTKSEQLSTNEQDLENYSELAEKISNARLRKDTAIYDFQEANAEFTIAINKMNSLDCSNQAMEILSEIKRIIPSMAKSAIPGSPSEYTFEKDKNTVDVSITLNKKKNSK